MTTIDASYGKGIDNHGQRTALLVERPARNAPAFLPRPRGKNTGRPRACAPTITRAAGDGNLALRDGVGLRRLTPRECERLMTWPDDWTRYGLRSDGRVVELADRARYTLCGNGVMPAVVRPIIDLLTRS